MEVDDSAREDVYNSDLPDDCGSDGNASIHSEGDNNGEIPHRRQAARDGLDALHDAEWLDLQSEGEMEDWEEGRRRRRLNSAA